MPAKTDREYRALLSPLAVGGVQKRIDSDFYVEGYATTFDSPYLLYEFDGEKYYEVIERAAFDGADLTDVILQFDHEGRVYARSTNRTLGIEPDTKGLFIYADLAKTSTARSLHEDISSGMITRMSWSWGKKQSDDMYYDRKTKTMYWKKIRKVYDVSAVSIPANAGTEISARSWLDGVIEAENREAAARQQNLEFLKKKYLLLGGY